MTLNSMNLVMEVRDIKLETHPVGQKSPKSDHNQKSFCKTNGLPQNRITLKSQMKVQLPNTNGATKGNNVRRYTPLNLSPFSFYVRSEQHQIDPYAEEDNDRKVIVVDNNLDQKKFENMNNIHLSTGGLRSFKTMLPSSKLVSVKIEEKTNRTKNRKRRGACLLRYVHDLTGKDVGKYDFADDIPITGETLSKKIIESPKQKEIINENNEEYEYWFNGQVRHSNYNKCPIELPLNFTVLNSKTKLTNMEVTTINEKATEVVSVQCIDTTSQCMKCDELMSRVERCEKEIEELKRSNAKLLMDLSITINSLKKIGNVLTGSTHEVLRQHMETEPQQVKELIVKEWKPKEHKAEIIPVEKPKIACVKEIEAPEQLVKLVDTTTVEEITPQVLESETIVKEKKVKPVLQNIKFGAPRTIDNKLISHCEKKITRIPNPLQSARACDIPDDQIPSTSKEVKKGKIDLQPYVPKKKTDENKRPKGIFPEVWSDIIKRHPVGSTEWEKHRKLLVRKELFRAFCCIHSKLHKAWTQMYSAAKNPWLLYCDKQWKTILTYEEKDELYEALKLWEDKAKTYIDPQLKIEWQHLLVRNGKNSNKNNSTTVKQNGDNVTNSDNKTKQ